MSVYSSVQLLTAGNTIDLNSGSPFHFLKDSGLGMAPVRRIVEQGPQQHGDSDLGYRLRPRFAVLIMGIETDSESDFWTQRQTLMNHFAPYNAPKLRFTLKNGNVRQLDMQHESDLDMPSDGRFITVQRLAVGIRAADPTFYDPTAVSENFNLGGGSDALEVPLVVPMVVGASTLDETKTINYTGNWFAFPQIRITGPITDAVITNTAINEKLDFTGTTIAGGDYYDIDTRYGQKTVTDSSGVNQIADLTTDSDLATFALWPASDDVPGGANSIRVTGSSVSADTDVVFTFQPRFLGI